MADVIFFHANCPDGFTAAWMWKRWVWPDAVLVASSYNVTEWRDHVSPGDNVGVFDFSFPPEQTDSIIERVHLDGGGRFILLDHHASARADHEQYRADEVDAFQYDDGPALYLSTWPESKMNPIDVANMWKGGADIVQFDMEMSGAGMVMRLLSALGVGDSSQLIPNSPLDDWWFVPHVEDRDLWRFDFGDRTRNLFAAMTSRQYELEVWDALGRCGADEAAKEQVFAEGAAINRYRDQLVDDGLRRARTIDFAGYDGIPIVDVPYAICSDTAGRLAEPDDVPFAIAYNVGADNMAALSLRSRGGGADVSVIAKGLGGGGHRNAAGCRIPAVQVANLSRPLKDRA